jgi:DNA-binding NarL/FixJ family response regulator
VSIRVLIADDQPLLRNGFRVLIETAPDMVVVGEAATGREAVQLARETTPDVVLMDIRMPDTDGLTATREITEDESLAGVRVLILTTFEVDEYVFRALRYGASGFLGKGAEPDELLHAIRVVHRGESLLSPVATRTLVERFLRHPDHETESSPERLAVLTDREREILVHVAHGLTNDEIAADLVLSPATVKTHVNRAMTKLGVRDRAQLVVIAYRDGLVGSK